MTFMPSFKTEDELKAHQLEGLQWTVRHAYHGSSFYKNKMDEAGIRPEDIQSLDDLEKLPWTEQSRPDLKILSGVPSLSGARWNWLTTGLYPAQKVRANGSLMKGTIRNRFLVSNQLPDLA